MTGWEARARNAWMWAGGGNEPELEQMVRVSGRTLISSANETLLTG